MKTIQESALRAAGLLPVPAAHTVKVFRTYVVPMGHKQFYEEVARGRIRIVKDGARTLVPAGEGPRFIALLEADRDARSLAAAGA
jgi:hypothetical protein